MSDPSSALDSRASTVATVADEIRKAVKSGRFSPGHRLVEAELTRELGVSRGPVREAIARLEAEGLVETVPRKGASVRRMTRQDVADLFAVREFLEGGAARLAAQRIGEDGHRRRLKEELSRNRPWLRTKETNGYSEANERFHELIVELADNRSLAALIGQVQTQAYRVLFLGFLSIDNVRESARQHVEIADAILAGDPAAAEEAMRRHIRTTGEETLALEHPYFG